MNVPNAVTTLPCYAMGISAPVTSNALPSPASVALVHLATPSLQETGATTPLVSLIMTVYQRIASIRSVCLAIELLHPTSLITFAMENSVTPTLNACLKHVLV